MLTDHSNTGQLFIVATPIGNLEDISTRAIQTLQSVDLILAEDTRHSKKLCQTLNINTPMSACHDHNESTQADLWIQMLEQGQQIALISDAGTPTISDPGYKLVAKAQDKQIQVTPIPGACALIAALSAAGLPSDRFQFVGFLPTKSQARQEAIKDLTQYKGTSIAYESPKRILHCLNDIQDQVPHLEIAIGKEITKINEKIIKGKPEHLIHWLTEDPLRQKGEFVVLISADQHIDNELPEIIKTHLKTLTEALPTKQACQLIMDLSAQNLKLNKNDLYQLALSFKDR